MRALLLQADSGADHFRGVDQRLAALGIEPVRALQGDAPPRLPEGVRAVALADTLRLESIAAIRAARAQGVPTLLVMDGIVEWRNTHQNPCVDERFLLPAPVDIVACAGWIDRAILRSMGNDARATGLPRLVAQNPPPPPGDRLLIATARRPAFNEHEHERVRWALQRLAQVVARLGVPAVWRITDRLAGEIGVERDTAPLAESLASARGVITTPSTLMLEAMGARRPTAVLHPHDTPLRHPALWVWRPTPDHADPAHVIDRVLGASDEELDEQDHTLAVLSRSGDAASRVARTIASLARRGARATPRPLPRFARPLVPYATTGKCGGPVRVCVIDASPAGADDALERARRLAPPPADGQHTRTLVILTDPRRPGLTDADRTPGPDEHVLVLDPASDHTDRLRLALDALERLDPSRVDAGATDLGRAIAVLHAAGRGRLPDSPDRALRLHAMSRWNKPWADDPDEARRWIIGSLTRCGAGAVTASPGARGADAVVLEEPYLPEAHQRVRELRRAGVGAVVCPALVPPAWVVACVQMGDMVREGARRLAVYGAGAHTRRLTSLFGRDLPIVAILDDAPAATHMHGRPVLTPDEALARHAIDGVLISSDAVEPALWRRATRLRRAGVPVRTIYGAGGPGWLGDHDDAPEMRKTA